LALIAAFEKDLRVAQNLTRLCNKGKHGLTGNTLLSCFAHTEPRLESREKRAESRR
jgi:hypothetical protein